MSFCTSCGAAMPDDAKFCTNCGAPVPKKPAEHSVPKDNPAPQTNYVNSYKEQQYQYQQQQYQQQQYQQQYQYQQPQYQQPQYTYQPQPSYGYAPAVQLRTNRGLLKFILLSIITFGIYAIVVMSTISTDINVIATRYDGKKTMHYCLVLFIFSWLTFGIVPLVWSHRLCTRIGNELYRRGIDYSFGAGTFWGWGFFGTLIVVGPFIYGYKLFKSMNLLCADYNVHG